MTYRTLSKIAKEVNLEITEGKYLYWENVVFIGDIPMVIPIQDRDGRNISILRHEGFPKFATKDYIKNILNYAKTHDDYYYYNIGFANEDYKPFGGTKRYISHDYGKR